MAIVTLSLNPTIDMMSEADLVRPMQKIRTSNETYEPGGGGVNVARVIHELGGTATVICPAGGFTGKMFDELLGAIPIPRTIVPIAGNTRISATVFERKTGHEYRFTPNGPTLLPEEVAACLDAIRAADFDTFVASGSVPLGAPSDVLAQVANIAAGKGARFMLDSSGAGLSVTLEKATVTMVKPSIAELEALVGRRLDRKSAQEAATDLVRRGRAEIVAVTMGAAGALVVTRTKTFRIRSPKVEARSAVGAGDAFVGAMTLAIAEGRPIEDALMFATAAGAATALTPVEKVCAKDDVMRLYDQVRRENAGGIPAT
ncbi:MAG: 1-phosphofructokinase family hexose kinase [Bauldia sp.]|jgi:6-phosphofructokinase 2|nr:1-phosphofructokinase family hexose kinase [Bauldia sp.]